jgi:3-oxoacyl-[acyl-carrier-protein] synthase-3
MPKTKIAGVGMYAPKNVYTNFDLMKFMDTSDEWIRERTGIEERHFADRHGESTASMGIEAAKMAIENAGLTTNDIDFIIFATLSPDYYFPGCGVLVQRELKMKEIGALDVRNQCSGFMYALSVGDQFIKTGMYKNILVIGAEKQSFVLDMDTRSRNISVLFGDGAGAVVLQATDEPNKGILSTHLHSDGNGAEAVIIYNPGTHSNRWTKEPVAEYEEAEVGDQFVSHKMIDKHQLWPHNDGHFVLKKAIIKIPEVIHEALCANRLTVDDINLLILNQSNMRISQYVGQKLGLEEREVYYNIQRYGNTTAASIPIAIYEAWNEGKLKDGDLLCLSSFGSGLTWSSALIRW